MSRHASLTLQQLNACATSVIASSMSRRVVFRPMPEAEVMFARQQCEVPSVERSTVLGQGPAEVGLVPRFLSVFFATMPLKAEANASTRAERRRVCIMMVSWLRSANTNPEPGRWWSCGAVGVDEHVHLARRWGIGHECREERRKGGHLL